eukprot:TRINITY_DN19548_c0_g1_i2.p1 TRINITY_DN19548_c0_g1~~TRINITY_DN19548_c0_g1_i2.p1  ORF type:complete len:123 (-),score=17.48 TRINITY_DN19548_c0_g1_i2:309-677(-)
MKLLRLSCIVQVILLGCASANASFNRTQVRADQPDVMCGDEICDDGTCCEVYSTFCCPYVNAICCEDGAYCCPEAYPHCYHNQCLNGIFDSGDAIQQFMPGAEGRHREQGASTATNQSKLAN